MSIFTQIVIGIGVLHKIGEFHGGLRLGNIFIDSVGKIKVGVVFIRII
jgi:serine/threonine protein kinase